MPEECSFAVALSPANERARIISAVPLPPRRPLDSRPLRRAVPWTCVHSPAIQPTTGAATRGGACPRHPRRLHGYLPYLFRRAVTWTRGHPLPPNLPNGAFAAGDPAPATSLQHFSAEQRVTAQLSVVGIAPLGLPTSQPCPSRQEFSTSCLSLHHPLLHVHLSPVIVGFPSLYQRLMLSVPS